MADRNMGTACAPRLIFLSPIFLARFLCVSANPLPIASQFAEQLIPIRFSIRHHGVVSGF